MANANRPGGLKPVKYLNGSPWNGQANLYYIGASESALYVGDPVTLSGTGDTNGIAGISIGVAGSAVIGAIVGFVVVEPGVSLVATTLDLTTRYNPASTAGYALVADDPNIIFEIQDGMTSTFIQVTDIGQNLNFLIAAGATTHSDSGTTTATSVAGTQTCNLKLMGMVQRVDNTVGAQYQKVLVKINNHVYSAYTGTASI